MTEVFDAGGRRLLLRGPGRSGGEGVVHRADAGTAVKLYHPHRDLSELHVKIRTMVANPPREPSRSHTSIAWPTTPVYADRSATTFVGFAMPFVDTDTFREAHTFYDPEDRLRAFGGSFTWEHLVGAAANLASAVAAIHASGHRVGDLRETNVLTSPESLVTLIDCDSFQVRDPSSGRLFPTRVASGEYLPRELHGVDFGSESPDRTRADLFALAVLVFRMLMGGVHPFQGRGPAVAELTSIEAKIARGRFPYDRWARGVEPPEYAPDYRRVVPLPLRRLFHRAFVRGHGRPQARPTAAEWHEALRSLRLDTCSANPNHRHGSRRCPWCAATVDPFPSSVAGRQRALAGARRVHVTAARDRATPPERRAPSPSRTQRHSPDQRGIVDDLRRRLRSAPWTAVAPALATAALAGALAPLVAPTALVLALTPAIATSGQATDRRLLVPLRFVVAVHRSFAYAVARIVPAAAVASVPYLLLALLVSPTVAMRLIGAAAALTWCVAGPRRDPGPLGADLRTGAERATRMSRTPWVWAVAAGLAIALAADVLVLWPLRQVPLG